MSRPFESRNCPVAAFRAVMALMCTGIMVAGVQAAEWTVRPDIRAGSSYNDNARMSEIGDEISVWGGFANLGAVFQRRTELSSAVLRPRAIFHHFPDDSDENASSAFLDFATRTKGLRSQWDFAGNLEQSQVLRSEIVRLDLPEPDLEEPDFGTTGRVNVRRTRTLLRLSPSYSYDLTERTSTQARLDYTDISFDREEFGQALDSRTISGSLSLNHQRSPVSRIRTTVFASNFEAQGARNETDSFGVRGRYELDITERQRFFVDAGVQRTSIKAGIDSGIDVSDTGFLLDVGTSRRWELTRMQISGGRSIQPTGSGFLRRGDQLRLNVVHQFLLRWYGELAAYGLRSRALANEVDFNDRNYYDVRATIGHEISRTWSIEGAAGWRHQDFLDQPGKAEAMEISVAFRYGPRGHVWSR